MYETIVHVSGASMRQFFGDDKGHLRLHLKATSRSHCFRSRTGHRRNFSYSNMVIGERLDRGIQVERHVYVGLMSNLQAIGMHQTSSRDKSIVEEVPSQEERLSAVIAPV
jgi:hypothetical protein